MCFFSFLSSLKTEADPLRLWRSYHLSILQAIKFSNLKFLLFPSYIIPICMTSYIKRISFLFLSFHTFFPCFCSQSFASFYFVLCFFLRFSFSLFYSYWQFSCPDESPVRWRLDRLDRHSLNTTRSRWAGKFAGNSNWEMLWKNTEIDLENTVKDTVEKCSWQIHLRNTIEKYIREMQLTNTVEKYNWKIHSRNAVDKYGWELQQ